MERMMISDIAQINDLWQEYAAAATAGDIDRWIDLWIDEGIRMPPGAPRVINKEEVLEAMQPLFDQFDTDMAIYPDEIQVLGDQAYTHGLYEFAMMPKQGGEGREV